jgi:hypothetical protein
VSVFKSAMAGTCKGHEELAASAIELEAALPVVPARGGEELVRRLEALERFVRREPLHRVRECVFAVPAMESETVDPRL